MSQPDDDFAINRAHWNDYAEIHSTNRPEIYDLDRLRAGGDTLTPIEAAELGDVAGLSLLHLQCHLGLDCITFARRGARVTGLDFSPRAIETARQLAVDTNLPVTFVEGNVYDTRQLVAGTFDLVFASWGVFCWIPDVGRWIATAASMLNPGGRLYVIDSHPMMGMLEEETGPTGAPHMVVFQNWRTPIDQPIEYDAPLSYSGDPTIVANAASREWVHPMSDFVMAVRDAGLDLTFLHEHEQIPWQQFPSMVVDPATGLWQFGPGRHRVPLAFSLMATARS
ncbi:MAG: class I SAM-dependent methyltransferase [Chloroflexia bacterium]|nr:class I SAM-dependent methyltransferase [Chloroflexia bacterium]